MSTLDDETHQKLLEENQELRQRIADLEAAQKLNTELEQRMAASTAEQATANELLKKENTERTRIESRLREQEEKYRTLFEEAPDGIALADARTGILIDCNRALAEMVERTREELIGCHQSILHPPSARKGEFSKTFAEHRGGLEGQFSEDQLYTRTGSTKDVQIKGRRITLGGQQLMQGIFRDITERKKAEVTARQMMLRRQQEADVVAAIATSAKLAEGAVQELAIELTAAASGAIEVERVGIWLFEEGTTRLVNVDNYVASTKEHSSGAVLLEHEFQNEFAVLKSAKYVAAHDPLTDPRTAGYVEGYLKPNQISSMLDAVIRIGGKNLGALCFEHVGKPHQWEDDEITFSCQLADQLALAISNRERKRAEEERLKLERQILQAQKVESLGVLAGGIAHDFNNILTGVLGTVSLARILAEEKGYNEILELMAQAERATSQARTLTKQLLTFSKGGVPIKHPLAVLPFLKEATEFALHGSAVRCEFQISPCIWAVQADADQLGQVVHNLVINAKQAMPEGGNLRISAENTDGKEIPPERRKADRYVKIGIEDRGIGILPGHLPRIFEPYFTTKQDGTGLGLSITHSIIEKHDGFITVESQLGAGTLFTFFLPACDLEIAPEYSPAERHRLRGRVLVMDDQEVVRSVCSTMLRRLGCEVSCARDGAEALAMYREARAQGHPFDVVIMDLTIPGGMGGEQAVARLLEMEPTARAIVSSGYASGPVIGDFKQFGFRAAMSKPYTIEELSQVLGQVLSSEDKP